MTPGNWMHILRANTLWKISLGLHYIHKWQSLVSWQYLLSSVNMTEYQLIPQPHPLLATSLKMCRMLLWCKCNMPAYNRTAIKWFPAVQEDTPHLCCGVSLLLLYFWQTAVLHGHPESWPTIAGFFIWPLLLTLKKHQHVYHAPQLFKMICSCFLEI